MNQPILLTSALAVWSFLLTPGLAQVTSDQTLKNESSVVEQLNNRFLIKGGATRGKSLFHSLKDLSIGKGQEVYFNNPNNINIILTRVTGGKPSDINGTLGVLGNADLFLMNPTGIHFGPNASLKLNGSFIATTGDSFVFEDGKEFSASNPQSAPDLKVSVPTGIQFNGSSGRISIRGNLQTNSTNNSFVDLAVGEGNTFALVGDGIDINGAKISIERGNIEILSLLEGLVSIDQKNDSYELSLNGNSKFSDINLKNSSISAMDMFGVYDFHTNNSISVQGKNISVEKSHIYTFSSFSQNEENIKFSARNLTLKSSLINTITNSNDGNISFDVRDLFLITDGSEILADNRTESSDGSNINIETKLFVALGASKIRADAQFGRGGNVSISASSFLISDDSDISASSELGFDGIVNINSPELNNETPVLIEKPKDIIKGCRPGQSLGNSTFVNVGRGGVPLGPHQIQTPPSIWQDLREPQIPPPNSPSSESQEKFIAPKSRASNQSSDSVSVPTIVEAQGWVRDKQGRVMLTASTSKLMAHDSGQPIANC